MHTRTHTFTRAHVRTCIHTDTHTHSQSLTHTLSHSLSVSQFVLGTHFFVCVCFLSVCFWTYTHFLLEHPIPGEELMLISD